MANLGEIAEIVNAGETRLVVGADTYIMLTNLHIHFGRPEDRAPTTDVGSQYTYGNGDHWMTFTLVATTPEIDSLTALNDIDGSGDIPSTPWTVVATPKGGGLSKTFTCTGVLRMGDIRKPPEGKLMIDCNIRITPDTIAVA